MNDFEMAKQLKQFLVEKFGDVDCLMHATVKSGKIHAVMRPIKQKISATHLITINEDEEDEEDE